MAISKKYWRIFLIVGFAYIRERSQLRAFVLRIPRLEICVSTTMVSN
jgi:hypothetical protein